MRGCTSVTVPARDLALERLVGAEQQLLAGLAAGVEGARHLGAAEGAVVEQAAVLAGEGHALGDALVDDVDADLGQPVDVGLARAEVAALDRVVEEAVDAVAVVLVVLGRVDAALGGDRVRPARASPGSRSTSRCSRARPAWPRPRPPARPVPTTMTRLAAVGRVDELVVELGLVQRFSMGPLGPCAVDQREPLAVHAVDDSAGVADQVWVIARVPPYSMTPKRTNSGGMEKPSATTAATTKAMVLADRRAAGVGVKPRVCARSRCRGRGA